MNNSARTRSLCSGGLLCLMLSMTQPAMATLIGDTIDGGIFVQDTGFEIVGGFRVVGGGVEYSEGPTASGQATYSADFGASSLTIGFADLTPAGQGALSWIFSDLDWVGMSGEIVGLSLASNTFLGALTPSFLAHSITIDWAGVGFTTLEQDFLATFDILTTHASVPEPSTLALLGIGLVGLGWMGRRRRKSL